MGGRVAGHPGEPNVDAMRSGGCVVPSERQWGWAAQLYSLRREGDSGIGDFESLRRLAEWSAEAGASFILVSPLHALAPGQESPYYPTTRCFRDPSNLSGGEPSGDTAGLVDRPGARTRKLLDRRKTYASRPLGGGADFVEEHGELLRAFAAFCVLAGRLGWDHRSWPDELRAQPRRATELAWKEDPDEARFAVDLQVDLDLELAAVAATGCPVVNDIAVGVDPGGFDAWWWQEGVLPGVGVGAPPDEFNADGQDWGVAAFDPDWVRATPGGPQETAWRMAARHAAGLRIDHVMGLSRQWLVPAGGGPLAGSYVRYPLDELTARLVSVSRETGAWIVGEDLGTVEDGLRPRLQADGIMSTKVIRFEDEPPASWPELALATASTHDLPPLADGADEAHRALAASPCLAVAPTMEDTLRVSEPPNRPGVDHPHNWRQSLPATVEELVRTEQLRPTAELMGLRSRS